MSKLIREMKYPLSELGYVTGYKFMNGNERSLSGSAPKSPHVVGFTRTKSPGLLSIKWLAVTAAYHFNIITIKAHSAGINRDWSDARLSSATGKSQVW